MAEKVSPAPTRPDGESARRPRVALAPSLGENVVYADGVHVVALRAGVVQLDLYQSLAAGAKAESRIVTHRLVLPVAAVNDLVRMLGAVAKASGERRGTAGGERG